MTIREAAARIGKHNDTIRRAIQTNKLVATKVNGVWDVSEEALNAYMQALGIAETALRDAGGSAQPYDEVMQLRMQNEDMRNQVEYLKNQIQEKDRQIENLQIQLQDASQRHDTVVMQMSKMLEYERQPFWRRWRRQKALPPPENIVDGVAPDVTQADNQDGDDS